MSKKGHRKFDVPGNNILQKEPWTYRTPILLKYLYFLNEYNGHRLETST